MAFGLHNIFSKVVKKLRKTGKSKIVYSTVHVDNRTGEVTEQVTTTQHPEEPPFVKLYLDGEPQKGGDDRLRALLCFLRRMSYSDAESGGNIVTVAGSDVEAMAGEVGVSSSWMKHTISNLIEAGLVRRLSKGQYQVNPYLFGKGPWKSVEMLRKSW